MFFPGIFKKDLTDLFLPPSGSSCSSLLGISPDVVQSTTDIVSACEQKLKIVRSATEGKIRSVTTVLSYWSYCVLSKESQGYLYWIRLPSASLGTRGSFLTGIRLSDTYASSHGL